MATVEKKVVAKARRERAISQFKRWEEQNPHASFERKVKTFDAFCDAEVSRKIS